MQRLACLRRDAELLHDGEHPRPDARSRRPITFCVPAGPDRVPDDESMTPAIETSALIKTFGATAAVDGTTPRVERGAVYGLLGPNGAGKTTTIRVLSTLLRPDGGSARVLGHDVAKEPAKVRAKVSLTGQF